MIRFAEVRAEWCALWRSRRAWWLVVLPAAAGAARTSIQDSQTTNGFGPLADGLRLGAAWTTLGVLVLAALSIARQRDRGALSLLHLSTPRWSWPPSRLLALAAVLGISFATLFGSCLTVAAWRFELGAIVEDGFEMATRAELWREVVVASLASLPAMLATVTFGLCISSLCSHAATALSAALVPFTAFDFFRGLLGDYANSTFVRFVPFLGDDSPLARLTKMSRAFSDVMWDPGELERAAWLPCTQALGLLVLAMIICRLRRP